MNTQQHVEPDAFLAWEREQLERHTYFRGEVFSAAGGSPRHSLPGAQASALLWTALRGKPCGVFDCNLRLGLAEDHFVYADAAVICPPLVMRPGTTDVVLNPRVVVEVVSDSTAAYERGDKRLAYLALPSVEHMVLVSQRKPRVEVYTRRADGAFIYSIHGPGEVVALPSISAELSVDALYEGVMDVPGDETAA